MHGLACAIRESEVGVFWDRILGWVDEMRHPDSLRFDALVREDRIDSVGRGP
jgi:hypothetical protein